ncbi:hypothetical protein L596_012189 [Steinernema carpocapsae]|uniref:7TM GPCR serpentine receptor class x (Srx) domain-containing protein n=1 Tax=Steinernema carpocapsae TaxID=34508 RepID=A0A4U5NX70_STECR|nr:hypothetical protein L596_012189 [Steinernema carpocapsae]
MFSDDLVFSHFCISVNRIVAIFNPVLYKRIFHKRKQSIYMVLPILILSAIVASICFIDMCALFIFDPDVNDIHAICNNRHNGNQVYTDTVVVIWANFAFSALARGIRMESTTRTTSKNTRIFL